MRSVDDGLRPYASETCLPAPANFPLDEDQLSSTMVSVLTLRICCCLTEFGIQKPEFRTQRQHHYMRDGALDWIESGNSSSNLHSAETC
jgi:hypothetical protein